MIEILDTKIKYVFGCELCCCFFAPTPYDYTNYHYPTEDAFIMGNYRCKNICFTNCCTDEGGEYFQWEGERREPCVS